MVSFYCQQHSKKGGCRMNQKLKNIIEIIVSVVGIVCIIGSIYVGLWASCALIPSCFVQNF